MKKAATKFVPVKGIGDGGDGVPQATYLLTYRGDVITSMYAARDALAFVQKRGPGWAILSLVDGERREVYRSPATVRSAA